MKLIQIHAFGYKAPFIFMSESEFKDRQHKKDLLCTRFPHLWSGYLIK